MLFEFFRAHITQCRVTRRTTLTYLFGHYRQTLLNTLDHKSHSRHARKIVGARKKINKFQKNQEADFLKKTWTAVRPRSAGSTDPTTRPRSAESTISRISQISRVLPETRARFTRWSRMCSLEHMFDLEQSLPQHLNPLWKFDGHIENEIFLRRCCNF